MTKYYWIIAQHSEKVLEVENASIFQGAKIIQASKKFDHDPTVDAQLWYFNGAFITNKRTGFVFDVAGAKYENRTRIIQFVRYAESCAAQEWEYNYEDKTISLKHNRKFVLDVLDAKKDNNASIVLFEKHGRENQQFILQKWDDDSMVIENVATSIIDNFKFLPKLSQNFLEILDDDEYYDVNIEVEIFVIILRYIYSGKLTLKEIDPLDIIKLLVAANELSLQELVTYIQSFLIENKVNWMKQNFVLIYQTSYENDFFLDLQKFCNDLISNEPDKIFNLPNFASIPEKLLVSIIQDDNLQMSEIQVWEQILKWGISQNSEKLPSNLKDYSKEDFNILKNTLKRCIPFIRFYNLTSKEFAHKIHPYKKVLPKELYENLLLSLLDPDNKKGESKPRITRNIDSKNIDSNIISSKHVELISKWVDRSEITDKLTSPYEFKLLFRGSRDGFYPDKFHEICDFHSRTVVIAKVKDNRHAVDNRSYYGPSFGNGDLIIWGTDINTFSSYCYVCKNSYEKSIRETEDRFSVEEYEVFQLMKIYS
ncbi:carbohydrate-binding module family 13 protein [Rhizophagus irregularis DAOM 181602=DAOM 197198]|nr:carbohydrate-binding module family 13 protein [Rhizophagus irregularis DAOM 181602=DAOM 197198]